MTERRTRGNILAIKERMEKIIDLGRKKKEKYRSCNTGTIIANRTSFRYRLEQNLWFNPFRPTAIKLTKQSKLA